MPGLIAVSGPALLLAIAGLVHPMRLTDATSGRWLALHVVALPLFPLLGLGPWLIARQGPVVAGRLAGVLGFVYAVCYTGLDVLAGIGAAQLQRHHAASLKGILYDQGDTLAAWGVTAYLAATAVAVAVSLRIDRSVPALAGSAMVLGGAASFLTSHIYWPRGVLTMIVLAGGWTLLALSRQQPILWSPPHRVIAR